MCYRGIRKQDIRIIFTKSGVERNVAYKYKNMRIRLLYFSRFAVGELADGEKCRAASEVPHWVIWIADWRWESIRFMAVVIGRMKIGEKTRDNR